MTSPKVWVNRHMRVLAYVMSSILVSSWTVLRFFTQHTIFDLVGQQALTQQLLHGGIAGAGIGVTSYLPKMFVLYIPMQLLPGSPRLKLIILTVLVNVATMILIGLVLERLLNVFNLKAGKAFYATLIWLSAVSGTVFWVQFTNSRNLEAAGGLFLLYEGLRYLQRPSLKRLLGILCFSTLLFFADPLQLYMTAAPFLLYTLLLSVRSKHWRRISELTCTLAVGYSAAKLISLLVRRLLSIHFVQDTTKIPAPTLHSLIHGGIETIRAMARLYSGGIDAGQLVRFGNIFFTCLLITAALYSIWQRLIPKRLLLFVGCVLLVDTTVYILSGQAGQGTTERYLIMTAPAVMLLFSSASKVWQRLRVPGDVWLGMFLLLTSLLLGKALVQGERLHFSQDAHLASVEQYIIKHPDVLPYSSMDTAIPTSYLYGSSSVAPLPLSCSNTTLTKDNLFYSQTDFHLRETEQHTSAAIILDGDSIHNVPSVCDTTHIIKQLGEPQELSQTSDGSLVLIYDQHVSRMLHY